MNINQYKVLGALLEAPFSSQRTLAKACGLSLGGVNAALKALQGAGFLDEGYGLTPVALEFARARRPESAVILAAGFGMRMVPINMETPKALLEVRGEILIERQIRQLRQAGIDKIYVVVGFMKERFEYLMDAFGVELVVNPEYARKNNLHSLARVAGRLRNCYIVPCDLWCADNPFSRRELHSWYLVREDFDPDSTVRVNRKGELKSSTGGNKMLGISYLTGPVGEAILRRVRELAREPRFDSAFWEEAVWADGNCVYARTVPQNAVVEINTYEQLREVDGDSNHLKTDAIAVIEEALGVTQQDIQDIQVLKKGMTNRSFLFSCGAKRYIMRIPGEGTNRLISRAQEAAVYAALAGRNICDNVVYMNPENGYKITEFLEGARVCDPEDPTDVARCMEKLRRFHGEKLEVGHTFDIFGQIEYYESLWNGNPSEYRHYSRTKEQVLSLRPFLDGMKAERVLTHIDAVPDNFLFVPDGKGGEEIRLIDWEYAGMQDPHVDIAMFCIYALYGREQVEALIDAYFPGGCAPEIRVKIYCYIAACGLLWSNWCEYKRLLGVEFGEYSLRQYRYAKDYYKIAMAAMERL